MNNSTSPILLLNYLTPIITDCILLFSDNTFEMGCITSNADGTPLPVQNSYTNGTWEQKENGIAINFGNETIQYLIYNKSARYYLIKNGNRSAFYYASASAKLIKLTMALLNRQEIVNITA